MTMKVVSASGDDITNFRFADDNVVNAEEEKAAGVLIDRLDRNRTTTMYKMEIGPDKTKVMTNNLNGFQKEIKIKGQRKWKTSSTLGQSSLTKDQNPRCFPGYPRQQQLFLD